MCRSLSIYLGRKYRTGNGCLRIDTATLHKKLIENYDFFCDGFSTRYSDRFKYGRSA